MLKVFIFSRVNHYLWTRGGHVFFKVSLLFSLSPPPFSLPQNKSILSHQKGHDSGQSVNMIQNYKQGTSGQLGLVCGCFFLLSAFLQLAQPRCHCFNRCQFVPNHVHFASLPVLFLALNLKRIHYLMAQLLQIAIHVQLQLQLRSL